MCNYHADKIADSKNGKGGVRVEKIFSEWIRCPVCGNKTRLQMRADTELKNFPLYCPKCKQESLIDAKDLQVTVIKEIETKTQS